MVANGADCTEVAADQTAAGRVAVEHESRWHVMVVWLNLVRWLGRPAGCTVVNLIGSTFHFLVSAVIVVLSCVVCVRYLSN